MEEWLLEMRNCLNVLDKESYPEKGVLQNNSWNNSQMVKISENYLKRSSYFFANNPHCIFRRMWISSSAFLKKIDWVSLKNTFLNLHGAIIHDVCKIKVRMQCTKNWYTKLFEGPYLPPHPLWLSLLMHSIRTCSLRKTITPKKWTAKNKNGRRTPWNTAVKNSKSDKEVFEILRKNGKKRCSFLIQRMRG